MTFGFPNVPEIFDSVIMPKTAAEAAEEGKAARKKVPRSLHSQIPGKRANVVELLRSQEKSRVAELLPIRYERMGVSPFTFYRGNALGMAADLSNTPTSGLNAQICGDAHIANFGGFASPGRRLVFDINDFDETSIGPWEWDVKRLVTSVEICGRDRGFSPEERRKACVAAACKYREAMQDFAQRSTLDVWYAHLDVQDMLEGIADRVSKSRGKTILKNVEKGAHRTSERAVEKLTTVVDGKLRIVSEPPLIVPLRELLPEANAHQVEILIWALLKSYKHSLIDDRKHLIDQYSYVDAARKVVGVGSVGTRAWVLVLAGRDEQDPLVLQMKEAQPSVLERFTRPTLFGNNGQRVVDGQRLMQASSDILLGWVRGPAVDGKLHDFYIRQLWDWKTSPDLDAVSAGDLEALASMCAWTLARAHARSGNRFAIAGYLGNSDGFDKALADFAAGYADCNEEDYRRFRESLDENNNLRVGE